MKLTTILSKLQLSGDVWRSMLKNTIPPTVALWIIQSTSIDDSFDIVGYLPVIITFLESPMLPRVPFLSQMVFTCVLNCVVACVGLLAGFCSTQARIHTESALAEPSAYNSSSSVVRAVWLFFSVWALQTFRAYRPQHLISVVVCTIFIVVSIVTGTRSADMESVIMLNLQLLKSFFLAHGLCTITSLCIFPKTSRGLVFDDVQNLLQLTKQVVSTEKDFLVTLAATISPLKATASSPSTSKTHRKGSTDSGSDVATSFSMVKSARIHMSEAFAKLQNDLSPAKRDVGWSALTIGDLNSTVRCFRGLMLSLRGIVALGAVFRSVCEWREWNFHLFEADSASDDSSFATSAADLNEQREWAAIFGNASTVFSDMESLIVDGLDHASLCFKQVTSIHYLTFIPSRQKAKSSDPEKEQQHLPGGRRFAESFVTQVKSLRARAGEILAKWKQHDELERIESKEISFQRMLSHENRPQNTKYKDRYYREQQQLLVVLYIEYLLHEILRTLEELVLFAEEKRIQGETESKRLILPGRKRLLKVIRGIFSADQTSPVEERAESEEVPMAPGLGGSYGKDRMNLEHLPPASFVQKLGSRIAGIYHVIGSQQSFYGFRVACAVISATLIAFLEPTQTWFFNRRGLWAAVFIPFSMAPSSGEAFTLLLFRILGSIMALVLTFIPWYIVDGISAGVIVFFFIITFIEQYFMYKYPQYGPMWRPSQITRGIIIGYELQIRYTGTPLPPATETQDFPVYLIGPYRLTCVIIGVSIGFFWTIFPRPITTGSVMRKRLGTALFFLAEYHSCMHSTVMSWANGHQTSVEHKERAVSPAKHYAKTQHKLFIKETRLLTLIRNQARFSGFEPSVGGKFPKAKYMDLVREIDLIISYTNIVIFAATSLPFDAHHHAEQQTAQQESPRKSVTTMSPFKWTNSLGQLVTKCSSQSAHVTALLCLIASSVSNMQPLPPGLRAPEPFYVARQMRKMRPELLDLKHATEPGYSAFAVIEVSATMLTQSLERILNIVKELAGELNFDIEMLKDQKL